MKTYPVNESTIRRMTVNTLKLLVTLLDAPKHRATLTGRDQGGPAEALVRRGWIERFGRASGLTAQGGRKQIWRLSVEISPELIDLIRDIADSQ